MRSEHKFNRSVWTFLHCFSFECFHIEMVRFFGRRRFSNRFTVFFIILVIFLIISVQNRSHPIIFNQMNNEIDRDPRLFCIVVQTNITEEIFINATTITWGTRCYEFIIVKSTDLQTSDNGKSVNRIDF